MSCRPVPLASRDKISMFSSRFFWRRCSLETVKRAPGSPLQGLWIIRTERARGTDPFLWPTFLDGLPLAPLKMNSSGLSR